MPERVATPLARLIAPTSIAVVGASSTRADATGNQVLRHLHATGYRGRIEVISPSGAVIEGVQSVRTAAELDSIDTAIVAVRPDAVGDVLDDLADAGVGGAIVMSVGLDADQIARVAAFARRDDFAVHGPNCMGLINVHDSIAMWADEGTLIGLVPGNVALISQSGSAAIFIARSTSGVGFSYVVSTGNEAALSTADYIDALVDDDATEVIGVVVESIGDSTAFERSVERARAAGKPVVALKVGISDAGARATVAHTGAMLTNRSVMDAYFSRLGVPLLADYDELATALDLLSRLRGRSVGDARVAVATISGGQAALAADLAEAVGVRLAELSPSTLSALSALHPGVLINNPVDAGGSAYSEEGAWAETLRVLADDSGVDLVMAILDAQSTLSGIEISYEAELYDEVNVVAASRSKPIVIASSSSMTLHPARIPNPDSEVAVLRGIRNAFAAVAAASEVGRTRAQPAHRPADLPSDPDLAILRDRLRAESAAVSALLVSELLAAYGIPTIASTRARDVSEAVEWSRSAGYPVVLKIDSPDVPHRSDVGAVIMSIHDDSQLRSSWDLIIERVQAHNPVARIVGMEVQVQLSGAVEAFAGTVQDGVVGSSVGVGLGGVLIELIDDTAYALSPLSPQGAEELLQRTRLSALLDGFRNLHPVVDKRRLLDIIVRLSWLAADMGDLISETDLNPILIDPTTGEATVVDALFVAGN